LTAYLKDLKIKFIPRTRGLINVRTHMEDVGSMTGTEMFARRDATEAEVAALIGRLVFAYSRFTASLHYCVAWHNDGANLDSYGEKAEGLSSAELIKKIEAQAESRYGDNSVAFKKYRTWANRAHATRELRNVIMHSRWGIEPYGRHAIAISTPPFVQPTKERIITASQLKAACEACDNLANQLGALRHAFPQ
jgi:hypothetical protein